MTPRLVSLAALLATLASAPACAREPSRPGEADSADPAPGVVDGETARRLVEGGARLVDVRTPQEFAEGHARGAVNIPFDQLGARAGELGGPEAKVVLYCRTGRRSGIAAERLKELGYREVYDFQRFADWPGAKAP